MPAPDPVVGLDVHGPQGGLGMLRRRANGESVEDIRPDLIIPTGKRKGRNPSLASIYRALAEHQKAQAYPEAVAAAEAEFAAMDRAVELRPKRAKIRMPGDPVTAEELDLRQRLTAQRADLTAQDDLSHP